MPPKKMVRTTLTLHFLIFFLSPCLLAQVNRIDSIPLYGQAEKHIKHLRNTMLQTDLEKRQGKRLTCESFEKKAWSAVFADSFPVAMENFNRCWLSDDQYAGAYYGFAFLLEKGMKKGADKFYRLGNKHDSAFVHGKRSWLNIVRYYEKKEKGEACIRIYGKLIKEDPSGAFYYKKRAYWFAQKDAVKEALKDWSKAIELDPKDATTLNNRGYQYHLMSRYEDALDDFSTALELDSNHLKAHFNRAISFASLGQFENALSDARRCIELDQENASFYRLEGRLLLELQQNKEACKSLEKAFQMGDREAFDQLEEHCREQKPLEAR